MLAVSSQHTNAGINSRAKAEAIAQKVAEFDRVRAELVELVGLPAKETFVLPGSAKAIILDHAKRHGVRYQDIVGASRTRSIVIVRHAAMRAVADARPDMSLPQIGRAFNRDHTTIIHALRKTKKEGQVR